MENKSKHTNGEVNIIGNQLNVCSVSILFFFSAPQHLKWKSHLIQVFPYEIRILTWHFRVFATRRRSEQRKLIFWLLTAFFYSQFVRLHPGNPAMSIKWNETDQCQLHQHSTMLMRLISSGCWCGELTSLFSKCAKWWWLWLRNETKANASPFSSHNLNDLGFKLPPVMQKQRTEWVGWHGVKHVPLNIVDKRRTL